jgi:O-antigen ligase
MIASLPRPIYTSPRLVLGATLGLATLAGTLAAVNRLPLVAITAPLGLIAVLLMLRYPNLGLAALPMVGAAVPFRIGTGSQSPIVAALILAIVLIGLGVVRAIRTTDWSPGALVTGPTVALMLVWVLALLWSNVDLDPLVTTWATFPLVQLGGAGVAIISAGVLLLSMSAGRQGPWIQVSTWGLIACGALALGVYFTGHQEDLPWLETGGLFTMWVVALSWGQALFNRDLPRFLRVVLGLHALAWALKAAVLQTWWFSGWVPTLVVLAVILMLRSRWAFAAVVVVGAAVAALKFNFLYDTIWGATVEKGDLSRLEIWRQSLDLFARHPILGTGPAGYAVYFQTTYAGSAFSMSTHNNFADVLSETGLIGALVFGWLLIALMIVGWQARARWRFGFNGAFAQSAFAGLIGVIVAMNLGDWFIPFVYNQTIAGFRFTLHSWVFLGFLASLALTRPRPENNST